MSTRGSTRPSVKRSRRKTSLLQSRNNTTSGRSAERSREALRGVIAEARRAQELWSNRSFSDRGQHIKRIRDHIVDHADDIARLISRDTGKTLMDALSTEVIPAALSADFYSRRAAKALRPQRLAGGSILFANKRSYLGRTPYGVVGIISPWNYPFAIPFHETIMGLMAGNAIVLRISSRTQQVAGELQRCIEAGDLPKGLFALVNTAGSVAGTAFLDGGVDKLFFTGSVEVGKSLMAKAAEQLVPLALELGGNDAMIVCADANVDRAVGGALWAGFSNAGQSCAGVERIFVERPVYEEFITKLRTGVENLSHGFGDEYGSQIGEISTEEQLRKVNEHVEDAVSKGARITARALPAPEPEGRFFPPTLLESVTSDMKTMREETFGPVVAVEQVESVEAAIRKANDSHLGLTASVWSRNRTHARAIAGHLQVGTVTINDHLMSHGLPETPWGGFKQSGIGRTHGDLGLEEMTQPRVIVDDILPFAQRNMWWYPHSQKVYDGLMGVLHLLYARSLGMRIQGASRALRVFLKTFQKE
ncbi:MAG TPA: aldehyde dehydrogenase family protein [Bacteroidota bacterium]|nr:aldehyde dehydrogenase family protein [Bacteroidota bacterium]